MKSKLWTKRIFAWKTISFSSMQEVRICVLSFIKPYQSVLLIGRCWCCHFYRWTRIKGFTPSGWVGQRYIFQKYSYDTFNNTFLGNAFLGAIAFWCVWPNNFLRGRYLESLTVYKNLIKKIINWYQSKHIFVLAHMSWKITWAFLIIFVRRPPVCPSVYL